MTLSPRSRRARRLFNPRHRRKNRQWPNRPKQPTSPPNRRKFLLPTKRGRQAADSAPVVAAAQMGRLAGLEVAGKNRLAAGGPQLAGRSVRSRRTGRKTRTVRKVAEIFKKKHFRQVNVCGKVCPIYFNGNSSVHYIS